MTKKDYVKIADILNRFRKMDEEDRAGDFDRTIFLVDEFAYLFENENKNFNEKKFRKTCGIEDLNEPLRCTYKGCKKLQIADGEFCKEHI